VAPVDVIEPRETLTATNEAVIMSEPDGSCNVCVARPQILTACA
jgi:hypothetical protein